jgi:hypothetical protein
MNCDLPIPMDLSGNKRNLYDDLQLNHQSREVRVLFLCEGHGDSLVECTLKIISLDDGAAYFNALSYVWGDANETTTIMVNQLPVAITKSLEKCLQSLRHYTASHAQILDPPPLTIWVDAVCIYSHRTATKYVGTMRFAPQFFEGFNFTYLISYIWQYNLPFFF